MSDLFSIRIPLKMTVRVWAEPADNCDIAQRCGQKNIWKRVGTLFSWVDILQQARQYISGKRICFCPDFQYFSGLLLQNTER